MSKGRSETGFSGASDILQLCDGLEKGRARRRLHVRWNGSRVEGSRKKKKKKRRRASYDVMVRGTFGSARSDEKEIDILVEHSDGQVTDWGCTSNSHPDNICFRVCGAAFDACLTYDPRCTVDRGTRVQDTVMMVAGGIAVAGQTHSEAVVGSVRREDRWFWLVR